MEKPLFLRICWLNLRFINLIFSFFNHRALYLDYAIKEPIIKS